MQSNARRQYYKTKDTPQYNIIYLVTMSKLLIVLFVAISITHNNAAKILAVFPTPSFSHQIVFRPFTQELAKRGHEIVIITTDPAFEKGKTPPNLTEIDVHDISYEKWQELYKITSRGDGDIISQMTPAFAIINEIVEMQLMVPEVQRLIKEEKFDLLFLEACIRPALIFSHLFKAPVIQIASFGFLNYNVDTIGASWHPLLYPNNLSQKLYNLTKWDKFVAMWDYYRMENVMNAAEDAENAMNKRLFGSDFPTIDELKDNVQMMFLNIHPIWENNRPVPPSVVYIWGIDQKPVTNLPKVCSLILNYTYFK